jgi:hypothetical protein
MNWSLGVLMLSSVKAIAELVISLVMTGAIGLYGIHSFGNWIIKEALTKVHQGLPSLSAMTETMTCKKFDKNMNLVKSHKKSCRRGK